MVDEVTSVLDPSLGSALGLVEDRVGALANTLDILFENVKRIPRAVLWDCKCNRDKGEQGLKRG